MNDELTRVDLTPKIHISFKIEDDEDGNSSHYGKYTSRRDEYTFDRRRGILLGESVEGEFAFPAAAFRSVDPEVHGISWGSVNQAVDARLADEKIWCDEEGVEISDPDEEDGIVVNYNGYRILRTGLSEHHDRNSFEYAAAGEAGHLPHNPDNWGAGPWDDVINQYGSIEAADIDYACQDYERLEALNDGEWNFVYIIAELWVADIMIVDSASGNCESDGGDEYIYDVKREQAECALREGLDKLDELYAALGVAVDKNVLIAAFDKAMPEREQSHA